MTSLLLRYSNRPRQLDIGWALLQELDQLIPTSVGSAHPTVIEQHVSSNELDTQRISEANNIISVCRLKKLEQTVFKFTIARAF